MSSEEHRSFLEDLEEYYEGRNYEVLYMDEQFSNGDLEGRVDLVLEDNFSTAYKLVDAIRIETLSSWNVKDYIENSQEQLRKARKYYSSEFSDSDIHREIVLSPKGDLRTVYELHENTTGAFTIEDAQNAVTEQGRLGSLIDQGHLLLNHKISREEDEEYYEFDSQLDSLAEAFLEVKQNSPVVFF